jgi:hypothetical protein
MKFSVLYGYFFLSLSLILLLFTSCEEKVDKVSESKQTTVDLLPARPISNAFRNYWYKGKAEITSYDLQQVRYGEVREGKAVLVFVTEPFEANKQVKADRPNEESVSVLKLNATRKFLTGIYPYSIMSSTFYPVADNQHALKLTNSVQEWCGQVFTQLNNRDEFEVQAFSYFESEGDQDVRLAKTLLENEIWTKIRIAPEELPQGDIEIIPALEYIRLKHIPFQAYKAKAKLLEKEAGLTTYTIKYPDLMRTLEIQFSSSFPYEIESWTESYIDGYGPNAGLMSSTANRINRINSPYWSQNSNVHLPLRDSLGLD